MAHSNLGNENIKAQQCKNKVKKRIENNELPNIAEYDMLKKTPEHWDEPPTGEQFTKCNICGNMFEQEYLGEINAYQNMKTCRICRHKLAWKNQKEQEQKNILDIDLGYQPFEAQWEIQKAFENTRCVVIDAGNRFGKDRCSLMISIMYFLECLAENRHITAPDLVPTVRWWVIAPVDWMVDNTWQELKKFFPKQLVVDITESKGYKAMETVFGGLIEMKSGYDKDKLVGVGLDLVTITEGARFKDLLGAWTNLEARLNSPGRGRLKDRLKLKNKDSGYGKAIINSSPLGKNDFYKMWTWGRKPNSSWHSFQFPWTANPVNRDLAQEIIKDENGREITYEQDLIKRLGLRGYQENYLGMFLDSNGTVFKDFTAKCVQNVYKLFNNDIDRKVFIDEWKRVVPFRAYRASWDISTGKKEDSPTFVIRDMKTNNIVVALDMLGKAYEQQYDTIAFYCKKYNHCPCIFSETGHTACVGQLAKRGVTEIVINEQGGNKTNYVTSLDIATQNGDVHILIDGSDEMDKLVAQMEDYSENNGKYSNNMEEHDDFVSAMYMNYYDYQVQANKVTWSGKMRCV